MGYAALHPSIQASNVERPPPDNLFRFTRFSRVRGIQGLIRTLIGLHLGFIQLALFFFLLLLLFN